MPKQLNKGIDKEAMFKKIMPSAAAPQQPGSYDPLDSFGLDDMPKAIQKKQPSKPARRPRAAKAARETAFDDLELLDQLDATFDPLETLNLLDEPVVSPKPAKSPKTQTATKTAPKSQPAAPARQKRTVQAVKQAGYFPIDTTVLQNPAAPSAPVPAPPQAPAQPSPAYEPAGVLAAPAAPSAPVPAPVQEPAEPAYDYGRYPPQPDPMYAAAQEYLPSAPYPQQPQMPYPVAPPVLFPYQAPAPAAYYPYAPMPEEKPEEILAEPELSAEELTPVNLTQILLEQQLEPVIDRLRGCNCDCCRTQIALRALEGLSAQYLLAGKITEEQMYDRRSIAQVVTALSQAVFFVKAHPQH